MLVFEIKLRMKLLQPVAYDNAYEKISYFIDSALGKDSEFLKMHNSPGYKFYNMDLLFPVELGQVYQMGKTYTLRIRTVKQELAEYFVDVLVHHSTQELMGLHAELNIIPNKVIDRIYSLTPVVIKTDVGYWRGHLTGDEYEKRLKVNLIKKYNKLNGGKIEEDFDLFDLVEFKNKVPVKIPYKNIVLLGDKLNLVVSKNKIAQDIAYFSLGAGVGELNSRGCGFLNYRYV